MPAPCSQRILAFEAAEEAKDREVAEIRLKHINLLNQLKQLEDQVREGVWEGMEGDGRRGEERGGDGMACDAMRCDAMGWDKMRWDVSVVFPRWSYPAHVMLSFSCMYHVNIYVFAGETKREIS